MWSLDVAELARFRMSPDESVNFSLNGNLYSPTPAVRSAIAMARLNRYPECDAFALHCVIE